MKKLPANVRILNPDYYDYYRGTNYARIFAVQKNGEERLVGQILFQVTRSEAYIEFIEVEPVLRKTSLGTRLFLSMVADTAPKTINLGGLTPDGVAFFRRLFDSKPGLFTHERFDGAKRAVGL
jgi:hypothetical protein